jgi:hypothetical protein
MFMISTTILLIIIKLCTNLLELLLGVCMLT